MTTAAPKIDSHLAGIAAVFALGAILSTLDTTIVNVAIRQLATSYRAPLALIQWVATGYTLALATVIPLTGWASDRYGTKRVYIASILIFVLGSALAAAAWSAGSLVTFRIFQGLGGGMIIPSGMTLLTHAAGPKRIGRVMAMVGIPMLLGPILGPVLGGYFVDYLSWRWIFIINLPLGLLAAVMAARILEPEVPKPHDALDWLGLLLLSPGLAALIFGLADLTSQPSATGLVATLFGAGLVTGFIRHARGHSQPLIDIRLFALRPLSAAAAITFLFGAIFFGLALILPLYLQVARGKSAFDAGLLLAVQGVGAMVAMPVAGLLADRIGPRRIVLVGLALLGCGILAFSQSSAVTPYWVLELALLATGLGSGATMMPAMGAALGSLQRHEVARATTGLNALLRVGGSLGMAALATLLTHELSAVIPASARTPLSLSAIRGITAGDPHTTAAIVAAFSSTFSLGLPAVLLGLALALFLPHNKTGVTVVPGNTPEPDKVVQH